MAGSAGSGACGAERELAKGPWHCGNVEGDVGGECAGEKDKPAKNGDDDVCKETKGWETKGGVGDGSAERGLESKGELKEEGWKSG